MHFETVITVCKHIFLTAFCKAVHINLTRLQPMVGIHRYKYTFYNVHMSLDETSSYGSRPGVQSASLYDNFRTRGNYVIMTLL